MSRHFTELLCMTVLASVLVRAGENMNLIEFTSTVVGKTEDGTVLIAFMDGARGKNRACVGLMRASPAVAEALRVALGSALKDPPAQEFIALDKMSQAQPEA